MNATFGQRLKYWRNKRNLTQRQLSKKLNYSVATIGVYEYRDYEPKKWREERLAEIYAALDVTAEEFWGNLEGGFK